MSLPLTENLVLNSGDTWSLEFASSDLVGSIVYSQIKDSNKKLIATFNYSTTNSTINLTIINTTTALIKMGVYFYDVRVKRGNNIKTEYKGNVLVT